MGVCQIGLQLLTNKFFLSGLGLTGVALKFLYSYSSYAFWPGFLKVSSIYRSVLLTFNSLGRLREYKVFVLLAFATTFMPTLQYLFSGDVQGLQFLSMLFSDFWGNVVLVTKNFVTGLGFMVEWLRTGQSFCGLLAAKDLFLQGLGMFWRVASAYILALRVDDVLFGHGMTREIEWPEKYKTILLVTLASTTVYGTQVMVESVQTGQQFINVLASDYLQGLDTSNVSEAVNQTVQNTTEK